MIERIAELRGEAEAAIAAAADSAALEELRVRYLGRKAELPQLLREVAELPRRAARRGRQGRQRGAPGARGADRERARPSSRPRELDAQPRARTAST